MKNVFKVLLGFFALFLLTACNNDNVQSSTVSLSTYPSELESVVSDVLNLDTSKISDTTEQNEAEISFESQEEQQTLKHFYEEENGKEIFRQNIATDDFSTKIYLYNDTKLAVEHVFRMYLDTDFDGYSDVLNETIERTSYSIKVQFGNLISEIRKQYNIEEFSIIYIVNNSDGSKLYEIEAFESDAS